MYNYFNNDIVFINKIYLGVILIITEHILYNVNIVKNEKKNFF